MFAGIEGVAPIVVHQPQTEFLSVCIHYVAANDSDSGWDGGS